MDCGSEEVRLVALFSRKPHFKIMTTIGKIWATSFLSMLFVPWIVGLLAFSGHASQACVDLTYNVFYVIIAVEIAVFMAIAMIRKISLEKLLVK